MSEKINVEHAFNPEARQAQADLDTYMDARPYQDNNNNVHNPENGSFVNAESYFDEQRNSFEEETMSESYEDMSMSQLAKQLAEAEFSSDKTKIEDINDVLIDKLTEQEAKIASDADKEHNDLRSQKLMDRVVSIKDKELARLTSESDKSNAKKPVIEDDLFTYESEEELANKDQVIADKAAESEPVALDEIFDDAEVQEDTPSAEKQRSETIQDIVERIIQRRYDADDYNEDVERADYDKIDKIIASNVNKELDRKGITDPAERARQFEIGRKASYEIVQKLQDEANSKLREGDNLREDLDAIPNADDAQVQPEAGREEPTGITEVTPVQPEKKRTQARRRFGVWAVAAASLLGIGGYAAGRAHENHISKSHDTPAVDEIKKAQDNMRNLPESAQESISRNFEQAERFFKAVSTPEGKANFEAMKKMHAEIEKELEEKHGSAMTAKTRRSVADKQVAARLAALSAAEAEKLTNS